VRESWLKELIRTAEALTAWSHARNVPCLDLTDDFRKIKAPLYFIEDVHFNPAGNQEAAKVISQFLLSRKLCP